MKKLILVIIISLITFILSIQIVNDLKTKPYIEFDWIKNNIYTIIITFGSSDISNYKCGLYNETRFCVAKECNAKNNDYYKQNNNYYGKRSIWSFQDIQQYYLPFYQATRYRRRYVLQYVVYLSYYYNRTANLLSF